METKQVVCITGGARRIGRALAEQLLASGYRVVVHCNTHCSDMKDMNPDCAVVQGDLTKSDGLGELFSRMVSCFGRVDHLINNASIFPSIPIEQTTLEVYQEVMDIHSTAPFFLAKELYLHLKKRGDTGSIINMVDTKVASPTASRPAYYCAKGALLAQTKALSVALAPVLRVNAISPGLVLSNGEDGYFSKMAERLPLEHTGTPQDIVETVLFLLASSFVTGVEIAVDGGQRLL